MEAEAVAVVWHCTAIRGAASTCGPDPAGCAILKRSIPDLEAAPNGKNDPKGNSTNVCGGKQSDGSMW